MAQQHTKTTAAKGPTLHMILSSDNWRTGSPWMALRCRTILLYCSLLVSPIVDAQQWDLSGTLNLGIVHTDNLFLDVEGEEESDVVYVIAPAVCAHSRR